MGKIVGLLILSTTLCFGQARVPGSGDVSYLSDQIGYTIDLYSDGTFIDGAWHAPWNDYGLSGLPPDIKSVGNKNMGVYSISHDTLFLKLRMMECGAEGNFLPATNDNYGMGLKYGTDSLFCYYYDRFNGPYRYKKVKDNGALPIQLVSFTGKVVNGKNQVNLFWQTATETNNYGFYVERRASDSPFWLTIDFVKGNGTTLKPHSYTYVIINHPVNPTHIWFYRLKQVDLDGKESYSQEIRLDVVPIAPTGCGGSGLLATIVSVLPLALLGGLIGRL